MKDRVLCSGGPFFKSKMGEIYFTTYNCKSRRKAKLDNCKCRRICNYLRIKRRQKRIMIIFFCRVLIYSSFFNSSISGSALRNRSGISFVAL